MSQVFETAIQKIGRILARQYNIDIIFEGEQAYTDGKKIVLPFFHDLTEELKCDLNGYLDHEVAHCKFTDFKQVPKVVNRFHKEILNAVEDVRIERLMIEEFPGTAGHLNPLKEKWRKIGAEKLKDMPWPIRLMFGVQYEMDGEKPIIDSEIKPLWDLIKAERAKLNSCESTLELLEVTKSITKKVMKENEKQNKKEEEKQKKEEEKQKKKEEKQKGKGQKGDSEKDKGEKGEGDEKSEGEKSEENGEGEKSEGGQGGEEKDQTPRAAEGEIINEPAEKDESEWDNHCTDVHKLINSEIQEFIEKGEATEEKPPMIHTRRSDYTMSDENHTPLSTRFDKVTNHAGKGCPRRYNELKRQVKKVVAPIRRALERVLKVEENAKWQMDRERGKINTRSLSTLVTSPNFRTPFKDFTKVDTKNVAIELLVDMSGSMACKLEVTKQTVCAMAESLKDLDIPFEVTGFYTAYDSGMAALSRTMPESRHYNRKVERLEHHVFKGFDDFSLNGVEKIRSAGANVDGESVRWAASRLAERKQKRKILMVFSDGMPASDGHFHILNGDLKKAVEQIKKSGIECIGFGIMSDAVQHFYPEHVVINELKDLPNKVMSKLSQIITRGLRR